MDSKKVKLNVIGLTFSQIQAGAYALILAENEGPRRVPIIIGTSEAQSIAIFLEKLQPPRPITHDLFITLTDLLNITLKEIYICKCEDGVFFSKLVFDKGGQEIHLDARTSDAIAIALRAEVNIYMDEAIMDEVAVEMDEETVEEAGNIIQKPKVTIDKMNLAELQKAMDEAIVMENYEKASYIRDLINRYK